MSTPQPDIFDQGPRQHWFLQFRVEGTEAPTSALGKVRRRAANEGSGCVVAWGPSLVGAHPEGREVSLSPFTTVEGRAKTAPGTQDDLFVWLLGDDPGINFDLARAAARDLAVEGATLAHETIGFVYRDSRDLTGFVDGTANPEGDERGAVALVPDGRPGAGGSFVLAQRWLHDLDGFEQLPVRDQERVVGRTKPDSVELADKPADSHVGRVEIEVDGEELRIFRRSVPYASLTEAGLFFLAFSADGAVFDRMLHRMFGLEDGLTDRLTGFTSPITGSYYFAPPLDWLEA